MSMDRKAQRRMSVILRVEAGLLSATDGAAELGISREAYYKWANRAMESMAESLLDRPGGRPPLPADPEKESLAKELAETKADLDRAILALDVKKTLDQLRREEASPRTSGSGAKKNTRRGRR